MSLEKKNKENRKVGVMDLLKKEHQDEMSKILAFGEKYKREGEEMKKEFWRKRKGEKFVNLIMQYRDGKKVYMENLTEEKEILDKLDGVGKEKFIEEYMHDKILYSRDVDKEMKRKSYGYKDWKAGKVIMEEGVELNLGYNKLGDAGAEVVSKMELKEGVELDLEANLIGSAGAEAISRMELKEGVTLDLSYNDIGDAGVEAISKMELEEGVILNLYGNSIGDEGAKALAKMKLKIGFALGLGNNKIGNIGAEAISKMELKEGVFLNFGGNNIGDAGAEAISKMELKEGVRLNLGENNIGDAGAEAIMNNMELKEGVRLDLYGNNISDDMEKKLRKWAQGYKDNGINCEVHFM